MLSNLLDDLAPIERTRPGNLLMGPFYGLPRLGLVDWLRRLVARLLDRTERLV